MESTKYTCKHGSTELLSAQNYHGWKNDIMAFLGMDDALDIVLGTEAPQGKASAQARDYRKRSNRAIALRERYDTNATQSHLCGSTLPL